MHRPSICFAVLATALFTTFVNPDWADAGQVKVISACQTLGDADTVYRLANDIGSCGDCLFVTNNRITIDLQGHSIRSTCPNGGRVGAAITDNFAPLDVITVKNGTITGYDAGVLLAGTSRASVLSVTTRNHSFNGVWLGPHALVKFTESSGNAYGIEVGAFGQIEHSSAHNNAIVGLLATGGNCLITRNTANFNGVGIQTGNGLRIGDRCTVTHNTASDNTFTGIDAGATFGGVGHLVTRNVTLANGLGEFGVGDYVINCPSTVTYNTSTNGFPESYDLVGNGCQTVGNE